MRLKFTLSKVTTTWRCMLIKRGLFVRVSQNIRGWERSNQISKGFDCNKSSHKLSISISAYLQLSAGQKNGSETWRWPSQLSLSPQIMQTNIKLMSLCVALQVKQMNLFPSKFSSLFVSCKPLCHLLSCIFLI